MESINKKFLVVDDKEDIQLLVSRYLKKWYKAEVLVANNGKEAIELIRKNAGITVVILDYMMPVMDGLETAKLIKEKFPGHEFRTCMLTAKEDETSIQKILLEGVDHYLTKPVDEDLLKNVISSLLDQDYSCESPPFATIQAKVTCNILNMDNKEAFITELSEIHVKLKSSVDIEKGGVLLVHSTSLSNLLGENAHLYVKTTNTKRSGSDSFEVAGVFVGLSHSLRKKIRTVTIRGKEIRNV